MITRLDSEEGELSVTFDGREVVYDFGELDELVLAYATTIHKAQGLEYPAVVIPLSTQYYTMLARNLLYTRVTRGKRLVVLRRALAIAVKNNSGRRRGLRHTVDAGFTFSGMDREPGHAAATVGRLAAVPRSGLNPSGPRLASAPQR